MRILFPFLTIVFFMRLSAQSSWEWVNPRPQGNDLIEIYFINSSIGFAVGVMGTILKTTDGGENWSVIKTTTSLLLHSVFFVDENNGWVVGDSGIVLKSDDGGRNWYKINTTNEDLRYLKCHFLNNNFGYVIASGPGEYYGLYKTTNGGSKWNLSKYGIKDFQFSSSSFWGPDKYNFLIRIFPIPIDTVLDSSRTYIRYPSNYTTSHLIYFIDENNALYISTDSIFKTNNQWLNWTSFKSTLPECPKRAYFTSMENGFIFCTDGRIFHTSNGGVSFTEKPYQFSNNVRSIFFLNPNVWFAVGEDGLIIKTTDGGNHWREISKRIYVNNEYKIGLSSIHFPTRDVGYAVGGSGTVLKTTNSGANWISLTRVDSCHLSSTFFINKDTGWAVGSIPYSTAGRIYKTTNGGNSWTESFPGGIDSWNNVVQFINSQVGFVGSKKGIIWKTTNGGISWSKKRKQDYETITSIYFPSAEFGWAISSTQLPNTYLLLLSTNVGETWNYKQTFSETSINSVYFINNSIGWLVGSDVYKTTDSGETWIKKASLLYSMESVFFKDELNGYCVGSYGRIFKTSDGGETWLLEQFTNKSPASIIHNKDSWWIAGENLMLLKKSDPTVGNIELPNAENTGLYLYESYPNPFNSNHLYNPYMKISFELAEDGLTKLKIYDILGREIQTLVNEELKAGQIHSINFNASKLSAGIYFYQLESKNKRLHKKFVLIK